MITGIPRTAPKPVQQSIPPTMRHMGATMRPNISPLKAYFTGAFSCSGGADCCCGWTFVPQVGQKVHGDESTAPHFWQWSDMEWPSLWMRTIALMKMKKIGRASQVKERGDERFKDAVTRWDAILNGNDDE